MAYLAAYYKRCRLVLAPSCHTESELRGRFSADVKVFSRGVDVVTFSPSRRKPGMFGDNCVPVALYVGRVSVGEEPPCYRGYLQGQANVLLVVVGDCPYRVEMERELPGAVFTGAVRDREEIAGLFASSDFFVFPSEAETFGQVLTEAAASGLPRVVVSRGASMELVRHEVDGLVAEDVKGFAAGGDRLVADEGLRRSMGESAREFALARGWDSVFDGLMDDYRKAEGAGRLIFIETTQEYRYGQRVGWDVPGLVPPRPLMSSCTTQDLPCIIIMRR